MNSAKISGTVKFYNRTKGFGFIERPGEPDVFIHAKNLPQGVPELIKDQRVKFIVEQSDKGARATNLELV